MRSSPIRLVTLLVVVSALVSVPLGAYPAGPPPGSTGGFGESTCVLCHKSYGLNAGKGLGLGDLLISGFPNQYEPGKTYPIKLEITHTKDRMFWGFQLTSRLKGAGTQAGELKPKDTNTQVLVEKIIQYLGHTAEGIFSSVFEFIWVAPTGPAGDIIIDAAGNAANGDGSPTGDYIYSTRVTISAMSK